MNAGDFPINSYLEKMPKDVKKILVAKLFYDPLFAIELNKLCSRNYYHEHLICDNPFLWESLWLKYVSKKLPRYKDFADLKSRYIEAIKLYELPLLSKINKKYDIIYNNAVELIKIIYDRKPINYENITYIKPGIYVNLFNNMVDALENRDERLIKILIEMSSWSYLVKNDSYLLKKAININGYLLLKFYLKEEHINPHNQM